MSNHDHRSLRTISAGGSHAFPGPDDITRQRLDNNIVVLSRANYNSPSVVVYGYLTAGSVFDPDERLGMGDFTAAALMRGTGTSDFHQIYDALESAGASLGISGGVNSVSFSEEHWLRT